MNASRHPPPRRLRARQGAGLADELRERAPSRSARQRGGASPAMPGTRTEAAPTLKTCGDSGVQKYTGIGSRSERRPPRVEAGDLDEEVEEHVALLGVVHEHESTGAEPGQRALGHERRQHGGGPRRRRRCPLRAARARRPPADQRMARRHSDTRVLSEGGFSPRPGTNSGTSMERSRGRDSKLFAVPARAIGRGRRAAAVVVPAARISFPPAPSLRRPRPSKRVAMTVTQIWSVSVSSRLAPKMMLLASGCAASWTTWAASETSSSPMLASARSTARCWPIDDVVDALVVDVPREGTDGWMPLFVVLREDATLDDDLVARIKKRIREDCSPRHVPNEIHQIAEVPRTLSGKALEVPVKRILMGQSAETAASRESLANPEALDYFVDLGERS